MAAINVHEATIHSFNVTIKVLQVGKKQVTMGLFRQLPLGELLDTDTLQLCGVPWGHVRYWWEGDGRPDNSQRKLLLHVVWQSGDELLRAIVTQNPDPTDLARWTDHEKAYAVSAFLLGLVEGPKFFDVTMVAYSDGRCHLVVKWPNGYVYIDAYVPQATGNFVRQYHMLDRSFSGTREMEYHTWPDALKASYDKVLTSHGLEKTMLEDLQADVRPHTQAKQQYITKWRAQYAALQALPQLFIAV